MLHYYKNMASDTHYLILQIYYILGRTKLEFIFVHMLHFKKNTTSEELYFILQI